MKKKNKQIAWKSLKVEAEVLDLCQGHIGKTTAKEKEWVGKITKLDKSNKKIYIQFESARDGNPYELITELRFYNKTWRLR